MNTFGFGKESIKQLVKRIFRVTCLLLLPGLVAAQQEPPEGQDLPGDVQQPGEPRPVVASPDTHASRQAPVDLMVQAASDPASFIGKTLVLYDGVDSIAVGPVVALRRRVQDDDMYLIIDATTYFNTATDYAVAFKDVESMDGDRLFMAEANGMHLRGLEYYPDDYTDIEVLIAE